MKIKLMLILPAILALSLILIFTNPVSAEAPQLRWAGEKVVMEKYLGTEKTDVPVRFHLDENASGSLEGITPVPAFAGGDLFNSQSTVWSTVGPDGFARCLLSAQQFGECHAVLSLYDPDEWTAGNQLITSEYNLKVIFLRLEKIELSSVNGNRAGGNTGAWLPENPWDSSTDTTAETKELSQDSLLRARVKGWFLNETASTRDAGTVDIDQDGTPDLVLPAGRWVLPDDWPVLGYLNSEWDIMDQPDDAIMTAGTGPAPPQKDAAYNDSNGAGSPVAEAPVLGPFLPGHDIPAPAGYEAEIGPYPGGQQAQKSVVPNSQLNWWDAPMPPSLIIFQINDGAGCFKEAGKDSIYYFTDAGDFYHLTNPFYAEMIPAYSDIPASTPAYGYEWDSWDPAYGPYPFWDIASQPEGITPDDGPHPTAVEVYSDNHGEAMVFFSRDWNLDLSAASAVKAVAGYPYFRVAARLISNTVTENLLNTEAGNGIIVPLPSDAEITFSEVSSPGTTSFSTSNEGPPPPSGFRLGEGESAVYIDISTTAGYTGTLIISIPYDEAQFPGLVNESDIKIFHWENGEFVDRTIEVDTVNNIIHAEVNSLSNFIIAEPLIPYIQAFKTAALDVDADGDGEAGPGDTLKYTATVSNTGSEDATGVVFEDTSDPKTRLAAGSVTRTQGSVKKGNRPGDKTVEAALGTIPPGGAATVTFKVTINSPLYEFSVSNQATVSGSNFSPVRSDDPGTGKPNDSTITYIKMSDPVHGPGMSQWGVLGLVAVFAAAIVWMVRRRPGRNRVVKR
jgi:uncharacterized repeat protein (TIGR01451 family)